MTAAAAAFSASSFSLAAFSSASFSARYFSMAAFSIASLSAAATFSRVSFSLAFSFAAAFSSRYFSIAVFSIAALLAEVAVSAVSFPCPVFFAALARYVTSQSTKIKAAGVFGRSLTRKAASSSNVLSLLRTSNRETLTTFPLSVLILGMLAGCQRKVMIMTIVYTCGLNMKGRL